MLRTIGIECSVLEHTLGFVDRLLNENWYLPFFKASLLTTLCQHLPRFLNGPCINTNKFYLQNSGKIKLSYALCFNTLHFNLFVYFNELLCYWNEVNSSRRFVYSKLMRENVNNFCVAVTMQLRIIKCTQLSLGAMVTAPWSSRAHSFITCSQCSWTDTRVGFYLCWPNINNGGMEALLTFDRLHCQSISWTVSPRGTG